jgi:putative solute:sodium symporter small subunit
VSAGRSAAHCRYWQRTVRLTLSLLALWAAATLLPIWFAPELEGIRFFGWPLSYYLAAQGSLLVFVLIVWVYANQMDRLDSECLEEEG